MEQPGTPSPNGTASPSFPVAHPSANTQPALSIPRSPWNFQGTRLRTPSPASPSSWKPRTSASQMPRPRPEAERPRPSRIPRLRAIAIVGNVAMAAVAAASSNGSLAGPTRHDQAQITGQQGPGRRQAFARNKGSAFSNQNRPPTLSRNHSPLSQQRNNSGEVGGGSIDLGRPSHPSRSGSLSMSIMSSDSASTAVDGGEQPERMFGTTPDRAKSTSTKQTEDLIPPRFEKLVEKRKPQDLSGKVVLPTLTEPMIGGYGVVHLGNLGDRKVAVKMLKATKLKENEDRAKSDDEKHAEVRNERRLEREINVWAALKHRNICQLLGFADDHHDYRVMVSPWYKRGSAANLLNKPNLTMDDRTRLTKEVCEGLHYLHRFKVVHGDMKPTNVLVDDDGVAKLCDFGLVKLHNWEGDHGMTTTSPYAGTTRYKAPELFISNETRWPGATLEGDIYSLGCMMVEFIEGVRPFNRFKSSQDITDAIIDRKPPVLPGETKLVLGEQFWILLKMCWQTEKARPAAGAVVEYLDWF